MFNPFPQLLTYSYFAPTLLRVVAAGVFAYVVWVQMVRRDEIAATRYPIIGGGGWVVWVAVLWESIVALGLLLGYYTQIIAILGAIVALKIFIWKRWCPALFPLSHIASLLLFCIMLSLLLSGAGAYAFDLRL